MFENHTQILNVQFEKLDKNEESFASILINSNGFNLIVTILWSVLVVLGVIGNGLVIFTGISKDRLKQTINAYIINLAITDLLFVLGCIPFTIYVYSVDNWIFGDMICKLSHFFSRASVQATCLTLTVMTFYRCNLVTRNKLTNRRVSSHDQKKERLRVTCVTTLIWLLALFISCPDLIYFKTIEVSLDDGSTIRQCRLHESTREWIRYTNVMSVITAYALPLLIIVCCYARVLSHLASNQNRWQAFHINSNANAQQSANYSLRKSVKRLKSKSKKVSIMVAIMTLNFAVCWLPTQILVLLKQFDRDDAYNETRQNLLYLFKILAHTLSYLTPVMNPILYAFFNRDFCGSRAYCI